MKTSKGEITLALYPEQAPKAVENFLTHAKKGYYDGLTFHRVLNDFMIQGGDPDGTGMGGKSIWDAPFEDEFSDNLHNFRGALSMANSGTDTNGSQFFIVQAKTADTTQLAEQLYSNLLLNQAQRRVGQKAATAKDEKELRDYIDKENKALQDTMAKGVPEEYKKRLEPVAAKYSEVGGTPHLDNRHTVFGFVTSGMEVVDAIAAVAVDANGKPADPITILSITVTE
ncbi:MAG: peptidylprolyl isomerase [Angelakisella sp.]